MNRLVKPLLQELTAVFYVKRPLASWPAFVGRIHNITVPLGVSPHPTPRPVGAKVDKSRITGAKMAKLKRIFKFLRSAYAQPELNTSKLATDQPHFYTLVASLHSACRSDPVL
jgi:hypothetical protein